MTMIHWLSNPKKETETKCPKCGEVTEQIIECPRCGGCGCVERCIPAGKGTICVECEEEDEEDNASASE